MGAFLLLLCAAALLFYAYLKHHYNYWKRKGVPNPPVNLLFGNLLESILMKKSLGQILDDIYAEYQEYSYVGYFKVDKPAILLRDPELIRKVLVGEFASFHDNDFDADEKSDMLMARNPFTLKGQRWKTVRGQLTPCFTPAKIKMVFPLLEKVSAKMISFTRAQREGIAFDAKELASKFTTENVASCAFGLEGGCFDDPKAEFREIGRKLFQPSLWLGIKHLTVFLIPWFAKLLTVKFFPDDVTHRLTNIVKQTLKYRRENKKDGKDFISILNELTEKSTVEEKFTDDDVVAQSAGFFADGFETSSIMLTFLLYELAANEDVQKKLREEIDATLKRHGGAITYDAIQEMTYLDCVFSEGMRKNSPVYNLLRKCTKPFTFPPARLDGTGPSVLIEPGTPIWLSIGSIQNDSKYFENPGKFDPGRFSEENKEKIVKGTMLGFGDGPRVCLGRRFAEAQVKVGVVALIANFHIRLNSKTASPLVMDPKYFMRSALGGIWLDFYSRN